MAPVVMGLTITATAINGVQKLALIAVMLPTIGVRIRALITTGTIRGLTKVARAITKAEPSSKPHSATLRTQAMQPATATDGVTVTMPPFNKTVRLRNRRFRASRFRSSNLPGWNLFHNPTRATVAVAVRTNGKVPNQHLTNRTTGSHGNNGHPFLRDVLRKPNVTWGKHQRRLSRPKVETMAVEDVADHVVRDNLNRLKWKARCQILVTGFFGYVRLSSSTIPRKF